MNYLLFDSDEFKTSEDYYDFIGENSEVGTLKIQAYTANQAFPLEGVIIEVFKEINGKNVLFFSGTTDSSGIVDNIVLPTKPGKDEVISPDDIVYAEYVLVATYPKSNVRREYEIAIFDNLKIIQPIRIPIVNLLEGEQN
jgi:hypothetical protein